MNYFSAVAKKAASTRLDPGILKRLNEIAQVDRRSTSELIEICVEGWLPQLEAEEKAKRKALQGISDQSFRKREKRAA